MSEPPSPKTLEEILAALDELRRRVERLEQRARQAGPPPAQPAPPASAEKKPSPGEAAPPPVLPPLPPEALTPVGAEPAQPPDVAELAGALRDAGGDPEEAIRLAASLRAAPGGPGHAAEPPAPDQALPPRPAKPPDPPRPARPGGEPIGSFEQMIGQKWLLILGVAVLLLGGIFFYRYAVLRGWINPVVRCIMGAVLALVVIGLGEWAVRRRMRLYAAALFGVGIVWLYYVAWAASPNGPYYPDWRILPRPVAFGMMCVVTALGIGLSARSNIATSSIISLIGAMATPVLLSSGRNQQVALMSYLLVVNAGFLALAMLKRWQVLGPIALAGTVTLFALWYGRHYEPEAMTPTAAFAWALFAEFWLYSLGGQIVRRAHAYVAWALAALSAAALGLLLLGMDLPAGAFFGQLLALNVIVLAVCLWRRWQVLAASALAGTGIVAILWYARYYDPSARVPTVALAWALFSVFVGYAVAATRLKRTPENVGIAMTGVSGALLGLLLLGVDLAAGAFFSHLLILSVLVLGLDLWRRWRVLALSALAGAALLFGAWYVQHYDPADLVTTDGFAWALFAVFAGYAVAAPLLKRSPECVGIVMAGVSGALLGLLLLDLDLAAGAFFSQLLVLSVVLVGLDLWGRWGVLAPSALGGAAVLFGVWCAQHYGRAVLVTVDGFAWAFFAVSLAYAAAASALKRGLESVCEDMLIVGGLLVALLWCAMDLPLELSWSNALAQLLVLNAVVLAVAWWRRWQGLGPVFLGGTATVFLAWYSMYYEPAARAAVSVWAWALMAVFLAYVAAAVVTRRAHEHVGIAMTAVGGALLPVLWLALDLPDGALFGQLLVLDAVVLALALWRGWHWLRTGVLAWTTAALAYQWFGDLPPYRTLAELVERLAAAGQTDLGVRLVWSVWIWIFFALITADVLGRAFRRGWAGRRDLDGREDLRFLDPVLGTVATAMMFSATWRLLDLWHHDWMGLYTAGLGGGALAVGWAVLRRARRRRLAWAYFGQGMVLITLAIPIHFEYASVTIAWTVQAVVTMLIAKRLRHLVLVFKSVLLLALAAAHFYVMELPRDPKVTETLFTVWGVAVSNGLGLAAVLAAGMILAAAILRLGRPIAVEKEDACLAAMLVLTGLVLYFLRTPVELPTIAATWWWLVLPAALAAVGAWRRSGWLSLLSAAALAVTAVKFVLHDTLGQWRHGPESLADLVVVNWQFAGAIALAAAMLAQQSLMRFTRGDVLVPELDFTVVARTYQTIAGVCLIVWAGSLEVHRYFARHGGAWEDPALAEQMGLSIWWALFAAVVLAAGFLNKRALLRYLAILAFAVTVAKVFLVDMKGVEAFYRILSFLALGALLMAASFLYHRYFRAPADAREQARPPDDAA